MKEKGKNTLNRDSIVRAFYSQPIPVPHAAPLHHYNILSEEGLIGAPYSIEELEKMACECVLRLLTIDIDNYAAMLRPLIEKPKLNTSEQLRYDRLMRDKERTMATRNEVARIAVGYADAGIDAHLLVDKMTKRYEIFWSKPLHLITNLGDE